MTKVVYFTQTGNSRKIASYIADDKMLPMYKISPIEHYPSNLEDLSKIAKVELENGLKREIKPLPFAYGESIYLVFPSWHRRPPMPIISFLDKYKPEEVVAIVSSYEDVGLCEFILKGKCKNLKVISVKEGHESEVLKKL